MTSESSASDVYGIMADAVATAANETKEAVCYVRGEFNARKIILPEGADQIEYKKALRNVGIILRNTVPTDLQEQKDLQEDEGE